MAMTEHRYLPLAKLHASPLNHRKRFDKVKLDELADSIRAQGVIQPILARPRNGGDEFEVVAGERRYRAAKIAGLNDIPALVRELTDAQTLELQVIENGQRQDVHPLEEAEGYEALLACTTTEGTKYTVEDIAAKIGKGKGYVYARLKLTALCKEARQAFYDDKISASVALLIARIPSTELQRKALAEVGPTKREDAMNFREAAEHVQRQFMLRLAEAPFKTDDATLVAKAGACIACPKRTGNQPELFGDVKSADVCTDPKCFDDKRQAHYQKAVKALEEQGKKVVSGAEAKKAFPNWDSDNDYSREYLSDRYVAMSGHTYVGHQQRAVRDVLGEDYKPLLLQHPGTGGIVEVATRQAVAAASERGTSSSAKKKSSAATKGPKAPDIDDVLTERLAKLIHQKAPKQFAKGWYVQLAKQLVEHLSTRDLEAVAIAWEWKASAFRSAAYGPRRLPAEAEKLNERDLMLLMFHLVFAIGQYTRKKVLDLFDIKEDRVREEIIEERKKARAVAKLDKANPEGKSKPTKKAAANKSAKPKKKKRA